MLSEIDAQSLSREMKKFSTRQKRQTEIQAMEVFSVAEYDDIELPSALFRSSGGLDLSPEIRKRVEVRYHAKSDKFVLRSNGWIGFIPLNERFALQVTTRIPVANLEVIMAAANSSAFAPLSTTRYYQSSSDPVDALLHIMCDSYLATLKEIRQNGRFKPYQISHHRGGSPRGRIDARGSKLATLKAQRPTAISTSFTRSDDHSIHTLIEAALRRLDQVFSSQESQSQRRREVRRELRHYGIGKQAVANLYARDVASLINSATRTRHDYSRAITSALMIVSGQSIALRGGESGDMESLSILLDMAVAFEDFSLRELQTTLSGTGLRVLDGNKGGAHGAQRPLYSSEPNGPSASPDIVIFEGDTPILVIDAKYKKADKRINRSDLNQAICYGDVYDCKDVAILYPVGNEDSFGGELIGQVGTHRVHKLFLDLASEDINIAVQRCADYIQSLK